jgi:cbb3-type cytochrome oxidase subunit 3
MKASVRSGLVVAASLLVTFGVWRWANHVLVPVYTANAMARGRPIGNNSDLYPVWLTTAEVLLQGRTPYSRQLTSDIQKGFYGRELDPRKSADPTDLQAFVYPLYVVFLLAPTVTLPFANVSEIFRWLLLICTACSVPLWMHAIGFHPGRLFTASAMMLAVSNFPAVMEDRQQNLSALVVLLLACSVAATVRHWLTLSGFLLSLSTIKPQLSVLLIAWMLLWAMSDWKERRRLVWSFVITWLSLLAAATAISPNWMEGFWAAIQAYRSYAMGPSIFQMLLPPILAIPVIAMLLVFVGVICWQWRKAQPGSNQFAWTLALLVAATVTLTAQAPHYQLLLLPALLGLVASADAIRRMGLLVRALAKATWACLLWQWGAALGLALCSIFEPASRLRMVAELPIYTLLAFPVVTLFAVVGAVLWMQLPRHIVKSEIATEVCLMRTAS